VAAKPRLSGAGRRAVNSLLVFVIVVLAVDALVGDKGLLVTLRARRQYREVAESLEALRRTNSRMREDIRQLKEEPQAIEELARKELGLIRPGEVLFIVKDSAPGR
jgi:cell division protein FtsB